MADNFDPYREWLGIEPPEQPPHYYRLLGLAPFDADAERIAAGASRALTAIGFHTDGPHAAAAARLSQEVAFAQRCLLDANYRSIYDAQLRAARDASLVDKPRRKKRPPKLPPLPNLSSPREVGISLDSGTALKGLPEIPLDGDVPSGAAPKGSATAAALAPRPAVTPPPPANPPPAPAPPIATGVMALAPSGGLPGLGPDAVGEPFGSERLSDSIAMRTLVGIDEEPALSDAPGAPGASRRAIPDPPPEQVSLRSRSAAKALAWGLIGGGVMVLVVIWGVASQSDSSAGDSSRPSSNDLAVAEESASSAAPGHSRKHAGRTPGAVNSHGDGNSKGAGNSQGDDGDSAAAAGSASHSAAKPRPQAPVDPAKAATEKLLVQVRETGEVEPVEAALAAGLDIETRDDAGRSLLRLAVMGDHRNLVEMLLDKKAQVNTADYQSETPLMTAAQRGDAGMVSLLLSSGASPDLATQVDERRGLGGFTALHLAIHGGHLEAVNTLLEGEANPDIADAAGVTPLMLACLMGSSEIVEALLLKDAQANAIDVEGQTVLMYAVDGGNAEIVKLLLLREGVRVGARSASGATAISLAEAKGLAATAEALRVALAREAPALNF